MKRSSSDMTFFREPVPVVSRYFHGTVFKKLPMNFSYAHIHFNLNFSYTFISQYDPAKHSSSFSTKLFFYKALEHSSATSRYTSGWIDFAHRLTSLTSTVTIWSIQIPSSTIFLSCSQTFHLNVSLSNLLLQSLHSWLTCNLHHLKRENRFCKCKIKAFLGFSFPQGWSRSVIKTFQTFCMHQRISHRIICNFAANDIPV
jgi:hypothetical protein